MTHPHSAMASPNPAPMPECYQPNAAPRPVNILSRIAPDPLLARLVRPDSLQFAARNPPLLLPSVSGIRPGIALPFEEVSSCLSSIMLRKIWAELPKRARKSQASDIKSC